MIVVLTNLGKAMIAQAIETGERIDFQNNSIWVSSNSLANQDISGITEPSESDYQSLESNMNVTDLSVTDNILKMTVNLNNRLFQAQDIKVYGIYIIAKCKGIASNYVNPVFAICVASDDVDILEEYNGTNEKVLRYNITLNISADTDISCVQVYKSSNLMPAIGKENKLYICKDTGAMFYWDGSRMEYIQLGGGGLITDYAYSWMDGVVANPLIYNIKMEVTETELYGVNLIVADVITSNDITTLTL